MAVFVEFVAADGMPLSVNIEEIVALMKDSEKEGHCLLNVNGYEASLRIQDGYLVNNARLQSAARASRGEG